MVEPRKLTLGPIDAKLNGGVPIRRPSGSVHDYEVTLWMTDSTRTVRFVFNREDLFRLVQMLPPERERTAGDE